MTHQEAMKALEPPLKFGDEKQIQAVKFIGDLELVFDAIRSCEHSDDHLKRFKRFNQFKGLLESDDVEEILGNCDCFKRYYKKTSLPSSQLVDLQVAALEKLKAEDDEQ